jgi:uncharacterized protein
MIPKMRTTIAVLVLAGLQVCSTAHKLQAVEAPPVGTPIKALLITGADPAHAWKANANLVRDILQRAGKFDATVVTNYSLLDSAADLGRYDVIVLLGAFQEKNGFNLGEQARKNLIGFVTSGKGFYAQHLASSSWESWDEFSKLCGRRWVNGKSGHPRREPFEVKFTKTEHPITRGLQNFTQDDECYGRLGVFRELAILAEGRSPQTAEKDEPILMASEYGKGRVVINNLGHDSKAMAAPEARTLITRSVEWAATGKVNPQTN